MAIVVPILTEYRPEGIDKFTRDLERAEGAGAKMKVGLQKAFLPASIALGALTVAAVDFAKAASEDQAAAERMAGSLKRTAGATDAQVASLEEWITAQGKALGVADSELRPALEKLAAASGSVEQAQRDAAIAMDLAAQSGVSTEVAAKAIAKAYDGSTGSLKKLLPGLDAATLKSGDMAAIMEELATKTGGAAAEFAGTAAGGMQRLTLAMDETKESLGAALLPAFERLMPILQGFATWAQENTGLILGIAAAVGVLAGGIVAANVAMKLYEAGQAAIKIATLGWQAAQWLLNAALTANPIGLVIVAIAAFIGVLVLAYNKVGWFRDFVDKAFALVKRAIDVVVKWFQETAWPILETVFGWIVDAIGVYIGVWKRAFEVAKAAVLVVWEWLRDTFGPGLERMWTAITTALGLVKSSFETVFGAVRTAVSAAWDFIRPILEKIAAGLQAARDAVANIPIIGGIVGRSAPASSSSLLSSRAGGQVVNVTVTAGIGNPVEIARQVENVMRSRQVRLGVA
jgi:hypothetical protein